MKPGNAIRWLALVLVPMSPSSSAPADPLPQPANEWVKRTPLAETPVSPRLGYEGACVWDSKHRVVIRYGGHNQGGGGEQGSEVWTFDPLTAKWTLKEPNTSPPGVCCNAQNVFDPVARTLHSLPVVQRQPRLAVVARDLSQRFVGLDLRPRVEHLAQHASAARAARRSVAVRDVGQRRAGGGGLRRRRRPAAKR